MIGTPTECIAQVVNGPEKFAKLWIRLNPLKDVSSFSKFRAFHFTTYLQIYLVNGNMVLLVMLYEPFYVGLSQ